MTFHFEIHCDALPFSQRCGQNQRDAAFPFLLKDSNRTAIRKFCAENANALVLSHVVYFAQTGVELHGKDNDVVAFCNHLYGRLHAEPVPRISQVDLESIKRNRHQIECIGIADEVPLKVSLIIEGRPDIGPETKAFVLEDQPLLSSVDVEQVARHPSLVIHDSAESTTAAPVQFSA